MGALLNTCTCSSPEFLGGRILCHRRHLAPWSTLLRLPSQQQRPLNGRVMLQQITKQASERCGSRKRACVIRSAFIVKGMHTELLQLIYRLIPGATGGTRRGEVHVCGVFAPKYRRMLKLTKEHHFETRQTAQRTRVQLPGTWVHGGKFDSMRYVEKLLTYLSSGRSSEASLLLRRTSAPT